MREIVLQCASVGKSNHLQISEIFFNFAFVDFFFRMSGVNKYKTHSGAFKPPNIPKTPSNTINSMLETRCGKEHTNAGKAALAYYICGVFQVCLLKKV